MSLADSNKQELVEEFLRKSLLGEELINTQFHLFSVRSLRFGQITKPHVLCANNALLSQSSRFFLDLLSSDVNPSDGSLSDIADAKDIPNYIQISDYGYDSDSDLDDDDSDDQVPVADISKVSNDTSTMVSKDLPAISIITQPKDEELSDDDSESVSSDMFVMSPEHPTMNELFGIGSITSGETAVEESPGQKWSTSQTVVRQWSPGSRHVLVKDSAFQTWYTLLHYLYTDKVKFSTVSSAASAMAGSLEGTLDEPRCSAKSMYRLASKVGLDKLRDEALAHFRSDLSEHNILKELTCSVVSSHPQLLEMELDVLHAHIGSAPVIAGLPALARRIADRELPHGAEIIVGIHSRFVKECRPFPGIASPRPLSESPFGTSIPTSSFSVPPATKCLELPPQELVDQVPEGLAVDKSLKQRTFGGGGKMKKSR